MDKNDFFEDDEPVEDVIAAFNSGVKGRTGLPAGAILQTSIPTYVGVPTTTPDVVHRMSPPPLPSSSKVLVAAGQ